MKKIRIGFGAAAILALLAEAGCVRGPDVQSGLALKRVVIYRNGVGYFERRGKVDADEVTFKVRREKVGDFLATLAVIEQGGSSVRSASFPVAVDKSKEEEEDDDERRFEILLKPPPSKKSDSKKDKLETVKLALDGREHDLIIGYVAETPVWRPSYRLVIHNEKDDPKAAKGVKTADLQAWGIVQNLSGEDWKGIQLSLVAGAPLAFQAALEKPVIPLRPIVTDQGEVISAVPVGETSLAEAPAPALPPPPPPMAQPPPAGDARSLDDLLAPEAEATKKGPSTRSPMKPAPKKSKVSADRGGLSGGGGAGRATAERYDSDAPYNAPIVAGKPGYFPQNPSPPKDIRSLAAVAMEAGTTRYDLPFNVDIPDKNATMVLLLSKKVPGESNFLFAPDGGVPDSSSHPFRVARFTNDTKGLLERGPIAVFESGSFLGQGMVDPLPPGATATVPFALERAIGIKFDRSENEEGARLAHTEAGDLEIERDWVTHTKYTVKNGGDLDAKTLIKHIRIGGTRLNNPPKGTEDNVGTGTALVPVEVKTKATGMLDVDERRELRQHIDWLSPLADDAVKAYIADSRADQIAVVQLKAAWEARGKLRASLDEKDKLSDSESNLLHTQTAELARNLKAIEKNKTADQLRKDLTDRLAKASARIDEITKRTIVLEMQIKEQSIRFRDLILNIKVAKPLPVP